MKITTSFLCVLALATASQMHAAVIVPDSIHPLFEDWSRGYVDSTYAEWDVFTSAFGATNSPDVGDVDLAAATVLQGTPGAALTGGGNIYTPSGAGQFVVGIPQLATAPVGTTRIVAQVRSLGTALDTASVQLTPTNGSAIAPSFSTLSSSGVGFGAAEEHVFAWDVATDVDGYMINFAGSGAHLSLDRLVVDTFTQSGDFSPFPTNIPEPAALLLLVLSGVAPLTQRNRVS